MFYDDDYNADHEGRVGRGSMRARRAKRKAITMRMRMRLIMTRTEDLGGGSAMMGKYCYDSSEITMNNDEDGSKHLASWAA